MIVNIAGPFGKGVSNGTRSPDEKSRENESGMIMYDRDAASASYAAAPAVTSTINVKFTMSPALTPANGDGGWTAFVSTRPVTAIDASMSSMALVSLCGQASASVCHKQAGTEESGETQPDKLTL